MFVWLAIPAETIPADPSFDKPVFRATEPLEKHAILSPLIKKGMAQAYTLGGDVQRRLQGESKIFAVVLDQLGADGSGQACAVIFSDPAVFRFVSGGRINHEFASLVMSPLRPHVAALGQDDCVVEVSLFDPGTGPRTYVLADFIFQSPVDGRAEAVLLLESEGSMTDHPVQYMQHAEPRNFPSRRWPERSIAEVASKLGPSDLLLALHETGFVLGVEADPALTTVYTATYFDPRGGPSRSSKICTAVELVARYPNPPGTLRDLRDLDDLAIAARSLPGLWHEPMHMEVAAYALCP